MRIPTPEQCGLPPKFFEWRPGQEDGIETILTSTKRVTNLCAPTGWGKSPAVVGAALLSGKPTCIVTPDKGQQDQYMEDFESIGMVDLRGRNNYKCDARPDDPDYTCEQGYASRCPYKGTVQCGCTQAEMRAATSNLVVTNYSKWIASRRFGQGMSHFQQVIFDECHHAPDALAQAMQIVLNHKEIEEGLKVDFPREYEADDMMFWKQWAINTRPISEAAMVAAQARIQGLRDPKPAWVKHFTHMRNLTKRISTLALCNPRNWIVDKVERGYQFDPIRVAQYAESALLLRIPKIIAVSATCRPKTMWMIGIGNKDMDFKEYPSEFDPRRSPFYYVPTMRVDKNHGDLTMLWMLLDRIASARRGLSGIVHTVSYDRQKEVERVSRHRDRMILNDRGEPPVDKVELFKQTAGAILVSPSVGTGYDFPNEQCRWQFICKIPFDPPSKILKAREEDDKEYRAYRAMQYLVQMVGRDMRHKGDWSQRFIGDDHMQWFVPKYRHLAPDYFHKCLTPSTILPPPMDLSRL